MADLTPELLAQLELHTEEGDNYPLPLRSFTVQALIAAAKERDQLRAEVAILKRSDAIKWDSTAEVIMADSGRRTIRQLHDRYLEALSLESSSDTLSVENDRLRTTIEHIKTFVADNALINDFELEAILKGEEP